MLLGERVLLEVTHYTTPCQTIRGVFKGGDVDRVSQKTHPGWSRAYARVLVEGLIRRDDPIRLLDAVQPAELSAAAPR